MHKKKERTASMGNIYAYVRVSTLQQNEDRQVIAMSEVQVPEKNIYVEIASNNDGEGSQAKTLTGQCTESC